MEGSLIPMKGKTLLTLALALTMTLSLAACSSGGSASVPAPDASAPMAAAPESALTPKLVEDGVLKVAMECAYAPFNWTQADDSNGAVPISGTSDYAYGYDVMFAKKIAEHLGCELEIVKMEWDALIPALQSGSVDAVIAGQCITADRAAQVDFSDPYYYASIVCLVKSDGALCRRRRHQRLQRSQGHQPAGHRVVRRLACPRSRTLRFCPPRNPCPPCWWPWTPGAVDPGGHRSAHRAVRLQSLPRHENAGIHRAAATISTSPKKRPTSASRSRRATPA